MNQAGTITLVTHIQHTLNHIPVHILFDLWAGAMQKEGEDGVFED